MTHVELSTNYKVPKVIGGCWQMSTNHSNLNQKLDNFDLDKFVQVGITTFDCADIYTGVEESLGNFRREYAKNHGVEVLTRLKFHTKFVPDLNILPTINKQYVERVIDRSLLRLQMDSLDLVQFHWWDFEIPHYIETALILQELQKQGKILNIGLTNFNTSHLQEIIDNGVRIVSNQVQYSILDRRPENGIADLAEKEHFFLLCYGTLAGGFLSKRFLGAIEPDVNTLENRSLVKYKFIIDEFGGWQLFQRLLSVLEKIANKHKVSISSVASRYILEKPVVTSIIIGVGNIKHLNEYNQLFSFSLDSEDYHYINEILSQSSGPVGDIYSVERVKESSHAKIMRYNLNN